MVEELKAMVGNDETVLYEGKPDKRCFLFESVFNPLLPVAVIWAVIDMGILGFASGGFNLILTPFLLLHMMPVYERKCVKN